jgi:hypothetical protein
MTPQQQQQMYQQQQIYQQQAAAYYARYGYLMPQQQQQYHAPPPSSAWPYGMQQHQHQASYQIPVQQSEQQQRYRRVAANRLPSRSE